MFGKKIASQMAGIGSKGKTGGGFGKAVPRTVGTHTSDQSGSLPLPM